MSVAEPAHAASPAMNTLSHAEPQLRGVAGAQRWRITNELHFRLIVCSRDGARMPFSGGALPNFHLQKGHELVPAISVAGEQPSVAILVARDQLQPRYELLP